MEYSIKSEDSKQEVVYQLLCMGCMCGGRTAKILTDPALIKYYENILSSVQVSLSGVPAPRLCWDCEALLKRAFHFTQQVQECFVILQPSLLIMGTEDLTASLSSGVCRVPRLQTCPVSTVTIPTTRLAPNSERLASSDMEEGNCEMIQPDVKKEYDKDPISYAIKEEVSDVAVEPSSESECNEASDSTVQMRTSTSNNDLQMYFYSKDLGVQKAVAVPSRPFDTPFKGIKAIYYPRIEAKTGQKARISLMKSTPLGKVDGMASRTISETKLVGTASRTISSLKLDGTATRTIPSLKLDGTATRTIPSLKLDGTATRTIPSLKLDGTATRTIPSLKLDGTATRTIPSLKLDGTATRTIPSLKLDGTATRTIPSLKLDGKATRTIASLKLSQYFKERHEHRSLLRYECEDSGPTGNYQPGSSLPFKVERRCQWYLPMQHQTEPSTEPSTEPAGVGKTARMRVRAYRERKKALKEKGKFIPKYKITADGVRADTDSGRRLRADLSSLR